MENTFGFEKKTMKWHKPAETLDLTNGRVLFLTEIIDGGLDCCYNLGTDVEQSIRKKLLA